MPDTLYFNGRFTTTDERVLGVEDRGFQFGDAVYEVFKFLGRRPVFLAEHFRRLERGLRTIDIPRPFNQSTYGGIVGELIGRTSFDEGIVYTQVSRGESERAHFWPEDAAPTVVIYTRRFRFPDAAKKERGIRVVTTADRRSALCSVKSVNLLPNALAKKQAQRSGADEAVLLKGGFVTEGASSNFFAVRNGGLVTHPLEEGILPGVVRDLVIGIALRHRIRVDERPLREAELFDLDEAFTTSTTQGVMPVSEIDGRVIGNGRRGEVTGKLQVAIDELERS